MRHGQARTYRTQVAWTLKGAIGTRFASWVINPFFMRTSNDPLRHYDVLHLVFLKEFTDFSNGCAIFSNTFPMPFFEDWIGAFVEQNSSDDFGYRLIIWAVIRNCTDRIAILFLDGVPEMF